MVLGALLPLWGVLLSPASVLPGSELGDVYKHTWSYWHTPHALSSWPWTEALNAPGGGRLWDVMLLPSLLLTPVTAVAGPVLSANLWVFLSLLAIGASTRALALEIGADRGSASVAGFVAQGAPYLYGYPLYSGVHERLGLWLFPLVLLCALRLKAGRGKAWAAGGVVAFAFVAAGCGVYGIWALLLLGLSLPLLRNPGESWGGLQRQIPLFAGVAIVSVGLLVSMKAVSGVDSLSPQPDRFGFFGIPWGMDFSAASFQELVLPWKVRDSVPVDSGDALLELAYLGWVPLGLCLVGLRDSKSRYLCGLALFFVLLSMGPEIQTGSFGWVNPVYWVVSWVVPTYGSVPVPFQQVAVFSSLASLGVVALSTSSTSRRKVLLIGIVLGSIGERMLVLPTGLVLETAPATVSSVYEVVKDGDVVELPRDYRDRSLSPTRSFLAQTHHQQGLPLSISTGVTRWDAFLPIRTGQSESWSEDLRCLAAGGFAWVVVDREAYKSEQVAETQLGAIQSVLGSPAVEDERWAVFALEGFGIAPSEERFFKPFQPLIGMDNGGIGPPAEARGPESNLGIQSGREAARCPVRVSGMQKSY